MPFQNYVARTFKASAIRREAPASSGVYGLSNALEWIYVGETDNIQARLLEHVKETSRILTERLPTGFSFELCPPHARVARQHRLILELGPACNAGPGPRSNPPRSGASKSMRESS